MIVVTRLLDQSTQKPYLGEVPMLGSLSYGIGDVGAGGAEQHQLVRSAVHHVKEGLHANRCIALET